jgi:hypothetical protein
MNVPIPPATRHAEARRPGVAFCALALACVALFDRPATAFPKNYAAGSIIVPTDVDYQDARMLHAYGLVYRLLSTGIPVAWVIQPGKSYMGTDFTASFRDVRTMATGTHDYRGGPFVVDSPYHDAALAIIQAWQTGEASPPTTVHEATAAFTADVARSLVAAPRMAVLGDGSQTMAFGYLNAAAIPDSQGIPWTSGSVDLVTVAGVAGPTSTDHRDGVLFDANGTPVFSLVMTMHWPVSTGTQDEAIAEIGQFLASRTLVFGECQSAVTLESKGQFLTDQGLTATAQPPDVSHDFNDQPLAQADHAFGTVGGSVATFVPTGAYLGTEGTDYERFLRGPAGSPSRDVLVGGNALQNAAAGRLVYLGGHQYTTATPISANPTTSGVRHFLDALLFAPSTAIGDGLAGLTASLAGPSSPTSNADMDFVITYRNVGQGVAGNPQIVVPIPVGMTVLTIGGGGTFSSGQINWTLANLDAGQPNPAGTLTFRLRAAADGTYSVGLTAAYNRGVTPVSVSSTVVVTYCATIPGTPVASNDGPVCEGQTLDLFASTVAGATYSWTGPNGFTSTLQNPSIPNATVAASGTYSVTATVSACASPAGTTTATVNPNPPAPAISAPAAVVANSTGNTASVPVTAGATYAWTIANGTITAGASTDTVTFTAGTSGTLDLSASVTVGGCSSSGQQSVPIVPVGTGLKFFTISPCRVADTRNADGPTGGPILGGKTTRSFPLTAGACGIPATAIAVSVNLTVVGAAAAGYLTLFPGDAPGPPLASNLNFSAGQTRANNAVVLLATDGTGTVQVKNGSVGAVHFVLDVNGYFQ